MRRLIPIICLLSILIAEILQAAPDASYRITNSVCSINFSVTGGILYSDSLGNGFSLESYFVSGQYAHGFFILDKLTFDIIAGFSLLAQPSYYGYVSLDGGGGPGLTYYFTDKDFIPYASVNMTADYGYIFSSKVSRWILSPQLSIGFLQEIANRFYLNFKVSGSYMDTSEYGNKWQVQSQAFTGNIYLGVSIFIERTRH